MATNCIIAIRFVSLLNALCGRQMQLSYIVRFDAKIPTRDLWRYNQKFSTRTETKENGSGKCTEREREKRRLTR